jgi:glycosyltransferase involved in cell wall biosynthesis
MNLPSPKLSVCIPAYNRPEELRQVLQSIARQQNGNWDVLVCEDHSPRAAEIAEVVRNFSKEHQSLAIHYLSNKKNLGYDGNLRSLLDNAYGEYCLFLGDDDLLADDALIRVMDVVSRPNIGVVLRAWKSVDKQTGKDIEQHRYFSEDQIFPAGAGSVAAFFRRSVFISGLTVNRVVARRFHTDHFDGMLLYQLYLVGRILLEMDGYYISDVVAIRRVGGGHFFGSSESEKSRFAPGQLLPSQSLTFIKGLFDIATYLEKQTGAGVYKTIAQDLGHYSYPMLEIQAQLLTKRQYSNYAQELAKLGLGSYRCFWLYHYALMALGPGVCNKMIRTAKKLLGRTPVLGANAGQSVK